MKKLNELLNRNATIHNELTAMSKRELNESEQAHYNELTAEFNANQREISMINQINASKQNAPKADQNAMLREMVKNVRAGHHSNEFIVERTATSAITSGVMQEGELTNMVSAGLAITVGDLINPMEMDLIYDKLGMKFATNVHGRLQWPYVASAIEATVAEELEEINPTTIDFGKITTTPYRVGIVVRVSNEAINDASFDLAGCVTRQINKGLGRTLNKRTLALSAPASQSGFVGPLVSHAQSVAMAGAVPTYAEIKALKGKVLKSGAEMSGFCYVMDAEMYSALEAKSKDNGSGRFIIENGMIDGDRIFLVADAAYSGKVVAGCFGYEALTQHGDVKFIVDPFTEAAKGVVRFILNADFALTYIANGSVAPFAVLGAEESESSSN